MPRFGFSGNKHDTTLLILFILKTCNGEIMREELDEAALLDDNADYFIYAETLADLLKSGLLKDGDEGGIIAAPQAIESVSHVETELPVSLRKATIQHLTPVIERIKRAKAVTGRVTVKNGETSAALTLSDGHGPLMELTLAVGTEEQAKIFIKNWKDSAEELYALLLKRLTENDADKSSHSNRSGL